MVPLWAAYWIVAEFDGDSLVQLAGVHGDDPRDVHDLLPAALEDCGVQMPDSDTAAARVAFDHVARLFCDGLAGPQWVLQRASRQGEGAESRYAIRATLAAWAGTSVRHCRA